MNTIMRLRWQLVAYILWKNRVSIWQTLSYREKHFEDLVKQQGPRKKWIDDKAIVPGKNKGKKPCYLYTL